MDYIKINKETWDQRTKVHVESEFYDVANFKQNQNSLNPIELKQVGDVFGKKLLHLQCHFGQDSLSWARLGAKVTGVDLSNEAITKARELNDELGFDAQFIAQDVYEFGNENQQTYDLVYTSYGVLCWLPDLNHWAKVVANALKPGGEFHLVEFHSFNDLLDGYAYFPKETPDIEEEGTYTENCDGTKGKVVTWAHSVSEVISALISVGLVIDIFEEHAYSPYDCFADLELVTNKGYQKLHKGQQVPMLYSIKAHKPV